MLVPGHGRMRDMRFGTLDIRLVGRRKLMRIARESAVFGRHNFVGCDSRKPYTSPSNMRSF